MILANFCPQIFGLYVVKLSICLALIGGVQVGGHVISYHGNQIHTFIFKCTDSSGTKVRGESHLLLVGDPGVFLYCVCVCCLCFCIVCVCVLCVFLYCVCVCVCVYVHVQHACYFVCICNDDVITTPLTPFQAQGSHSSSSMRPNWYPAQC